MPLLAAAGMWALTIALLLIRAVRQYGVYEVLRAGAGSPSPWADAPSVAVIIPARNEALNLPKCLEALLAQDYPGDRLEFLVVDDNSTDATPQVIDQFAGRDDRVRRVRPGPLPAGWTGKAHACWQGARAAREADWLCFVDADTVAKPALLRTAVVDATRRDVGLLSLAPFQELGGFWERLVMPAGFFLIAFTQDLRKTNDPRSPQANANGQFLLVRREVYERVGGFEAVRNAVAEDSAIARAVKRSGARIAVLGTQGLIRVRMYSDSSTLWQGLSRQAGQLLGGTAAALFWAGGALVLGWAGLVLPVLSVMSVLRHGPHWVNLCALAISSAATLALLGTHIGTARYFRVPFFYGLLFPISYTLGAGILLNAAVSRARGRVAWKGRVYPDGSV